MPKDAPKTNWLQELLGLCAMGAALLLLISLGTFDPRDPAPFFKAGDSAPARNFIGPFGAFIAELLVPQLFGFAAIVLPVSLGMTGWKLFWCKPLKAPATRLVGASLLMLSLTGLLTLAVGTVSLRGEAVRTGGAIGEVAAGTLRTSIGAVGAFIVLSVALLAATLLSTQLSFASIAQGGGAALAARLRSLRTAVVHYREARRKEQQRKEVLKKHAAKGAPREEEGDQSLPRVRKTARSLLDLETSVPPPPPAAEDPKQRSLAPASLDEDEPVEESLLLELAPAPAPPPALNKRRAKNKTSIVPPPAASGAYSLPPTSLLD